VSVIKIWLGKEYVKITSNNTLDDCKIEQKIYELHQLLQTNSTELLCIVEADILSSMQQLPLTYDPSKWHACTDHDWQICDKAANCYSYALNNPQYYWSQPGMGCIKTMPPPYIDSFNEFFKNYSLQEFMDFMIKGSVDDGLIHVDDLVEKEGYYPGGTFL
jgi:hypothetical protein